MGTEGGVQGQDDPQLRAWAGYWDWITKEHALALKAATDELKDRDH